MDARTVTTSPPSSTHDQGAFSLPHYKPENYSQRDQHDEGIGPQTKDCPLVRISIGERPLCVTAAVSNGHPGARDDWLVRSIPVKCKLDRPLADEKIVMIAGSKDLKGTFPHNQRSRGNFRCHFLVYRPMDTSWFVVENGTVRGGIQRRRLCRIRSSCRHPAGTTPFLDFLNMTTCAPKGYRTDHIN